MRLWNPKQPPWDHPGCALIIAWPVSLFVILWLFGDL